MGHPLSPIFEPRSVAIVGASADPEKRGHQVVAALEASGYDGAVYPINPRGGEILGREVVPSIEALPDAPDLAYVARPAAAVPGVITACGARGIKGAIVPAVGFRESGEEGARLEAEMLSAARETGIRVIGPNTSGVLNTHARLHMVGGEPVAPGGLGIVAQSGNIALDLMTSASERPIGISVYVGPGNETDIGFHEYLDFLGQHEPTRAIVIYVEGVRAGRALFETVREVVRRKPVIALKGGRSSAGGRAARSHTGAIAGSYRVFQALARQTGLIEVARGDELLPVAETLADQPVPRGDGFVVLSDGGGHATLSADHLTASGVSLADPGEETRRALRDLLGPAASVANPVDVAGASDQAPEVLAEAFRLLVEDSGCGAVLITGLFGGYAIRFAEGLAGGELAAADAIADHAASTKTPVVVHSLYASREPAALVRLGERGIPVYGSLERAVRCVTALGQRRADLARLASAAERTPAGPGADSPSPSGDAAAPMEDGATEAWLSEHETRELLEPHGVSFIPAVLCTDAASVRDAVEGLSRKDDAASFALKAVCADLPHKTEAGAVRLDVAGADEAAEAFEEIRMSTRAYLTEHGLPPGIEGVLVSSMAPEPVAELLLGVRRDPQFGPILTVALGGTAVELLDDVAIRGLPTDAAEVEAMCRDLRLAPLLLGHRGRPDVDLAAIARMALALEDCLLSCPEVREIELNPVFAYPDRAVAIDAIARIG